MRRLLVPALLLPLAATFAPAAADPCDPETGHCHQVDCLGWDPVGQAPDAVDRAVHGDPGAVQALLPPPCPPA